MRCRVAGLLVFAVLASWNAASFRQSAYANRDRIVQDGNEPVGNSVEMFTAVIKATVARWRKAEAAMRGSQ